ncbi:MAG: hypothetical protein ACQEWU_10350 [Bacillota bacterium]
MISEERKVRKTRYDVMDIFFLLSTGLYTCFILYLLFIEENVSPINLWFSLSILAFLVLVFQQHYLGYYKEKLFVGIRAVVFGVLISFFIFTTPFLVKYLSTLF